MNHDKILTYRGSGSDLATDIKKMLPPEEIRRLLAELVPRGEPSELKAKILALATQLMHFPGLHPAAVARADSIVELVCRGEPREPSNALNSHPEATEEAPSPAPARALGEICTCGHDYAAHCPEFLSTRRGPCWGCGCLEFRPAPMEVQAPAPVVGNSARSPLNSTENRGQERNQAENADGKPDAIREGAGGVDP